MNKIMIYVMMLLCLSVGFVSAACTVAGSSSSADYFGVNTVTTNTTTMAYNQLFGSYTFFTPRLNFTQNVSDTFTAGDNTTAGIYVLKWKSSLNISNGFVLKNGSVTIAVSNYTLGFTAPNTWNISMRVNSYNNSVLTYIFNRTFVKNVDDLVVSPSSVYTGAVVNNFLNQTGGGANGVTKEFRFVASDIGQYVNNTNWAVGWSYSETTCTIGSTGCNSGAAALWVTLSIVVVAAFLLWLLTIFEGSFAGVLVSVVLASVVAVLMSVLMNILNLGC